MLIRNVLSQLQAGSLVVMVGACLGTASATGQVATSPATGSTNAPRPAVVAKSNRVVGVASNKAPSTAVAKLPATGSTNTPKPTVVTTTTNAPGPALVVKSTNVVGVASNNTSWKTQEVLPKSLTSPDGGAEQLLVESAKVKPRYQGRLRMDYDYRSQGDEKDTDAYGYWTASGRGLSSGHVDLYTSGRLHSDLDSSSSSTTTNTTFTSLNDLHGVTDQRILQLYADIHDQDHRMELRGGRQYVDIADYLHIDGGQFMLFEEGKVGGRVYIGKPVNYYNSSTGDLAVGASIVAQPWTGNRTRLTFAQYDDQSADGSDRDYFVDTQQELADTTWMRAQMSILNGDFRMARLDSYCLSNDGKTDFYFGGSRWGEFNAATRFYSPLYSVLGPEAPYTYGYMRLTQALSRHVTLSPGVSFRITNSDEAEDRNRDYNDFDLTLFFQPDRVFSSSISLDYWDTQGKDSFLGISGEIRCRGGRKWDISLGTAYVDYTYTSYSDISYFINGGQTYFSADGTVITETPYSYTYFLRTKWSLCRNLILRLEGDIEDNSESSDLSYRGRASIEVRL